MKLLVLTVLRALRTIGNWATHKLYWIERRVAESNSLPAGTKVVLSRCKCSSIADHASVWIVERYDVDANDYRIRRPDSDRTIYAARGAMELVP